MVFIAIGLRARAAAVDNYGQLKDCNCEQKQAKFAAAAWFSSSRRYKVRISRAQQVRNAPAR